MIFRPKRDLAGQLAIAMMAVTLICLILSVLCFYVIYGILYLTKAEGPIRPSDFFLDTYDMLALGLAGVTGLAISSFVAVNLGRRIARPLRSVGRTTRRIALGDLTARATIEADAPDEAAALVADVNRMAERLETVANSVVTWNAQIAHELRTPLTILKGRLQGLVDGVFIADQRTLSSLLKQADGLSRLVEDLRVVSLSDSGRLDLQMTSVDLAGEIESLVHFVEPELQAAGFNIALNLDTGDTTIDISRTRQAILALIENARRHANPCTLRVGLHLSDKQIVITVIDQGPGLPPEFVSRAFGQFERADVAKSDGRAGSGLGLSVVQAITTAHGGEIAYSADQSGTGFCITLPRTPFALVT
ncbi:MAG TPA: two-component sensor histidine kinase [Brevundimonas sp.]|jgi:two-component system sensor histidine kinase AdeS|nr:two-component sensor histidine kinase [Brevundimonas sp.]